MRKLIMSSLIVTFLVSCSQKQTYFFKEKNNDICTKLVTNFLDMFDFLCPLI